MDDRQEVFRFLHDGARCVWVDLEQPTEEDRRILTEVFRFHPGAVATCLAPASHPRLYDYGEYAYLVVHAIAPEPEAAEGAPSFRTEELDAFLGPNFLVTYHQDRMQALEGVRLRCLEAEALPDRGPDRILAEILDELADGCIGVVERLSAALDRVENRLFRQARRPALQEIFGLKKDLVRLRRIVAAQREVLHRLARGEFKFVSPEEAPILRDVHDRIHRFSETVESMRDLLTSAMEVYLTLVSNRTNEVVKVLTVFSIVLMTTSLVAGIYGMNVSLPMKDWKGAFYVLLALMGAAAGGLFLLFRRRKWI